MDTQELIKTFDYTELAKLDLITPLSKLLKGGGYKIDERGKIVPISEGATWESPWIFVRPPGDIKCGLWHEIMFNAFNIFPPACKQCWKVVIRPNTITQLLALFVIEHSHTQLKCKCGIEVRGTVNSPYGGYVYCKSLDEARAAKAEMRALIDKHMPDGETCDVFIKRYCTEFEAHFGPSDEHELTERDINVAQLVEDLFDIGYSKFKQPDWIWPGIIKTWLEFAYGVVKDKEASKYNHGKPIAGILPGGVLAMKEHSRRYE